MDFKHTNVPINNTLPKLVRDNIPHIIEATDGKKPHISIAEDNTVYLKYLLNKVIEEAIEIQHHKDKTDLIKELADINELLLALMKVMNISQSDIETIRVAKKDKNGGFDKRYILESK